MAQALLRAAYFHGLRRRPDDDVRYEGFRACLTVILAPWPEPRILCLVPRVPYPEL